MNLEDRDYNYYSPENTNVAKINLKSSLLQLHAIKSYSVISRVIPEQAEGLQNVELKRLVATKSFYVAGIPAE
jgi:hypothetical protein